MRRPCRPVLAAGACPAPSVFLALTPVVHPRRSLARTSAGIRSIGYFGFGTVLAMIEANSPDDLGTSMWAVPVVIFDLVFVCWIYQALETIRVQLRQANQPVRGSGGCCSGHGTAVLTGSPAHTPRRHCRTSQAKLQMYNRLGSTLLTFVIVWVIFALIVTAIAFGIVPLEWQAAWALQNFWDCIYLVRRSVVGAPGARPA